MSNIKRLIIIIMMFMDSFPTTADFTTIVRRKPSRFFTYTIQHAVIFRAFTLGFSYGYATILSLAFRLITNASAFTGSNKRLIANSANQCNVWSLVPQVISLRVLCACWCLAVSTLSTFTAAIFLPVVKRFNLFITFNTFNFHTNIISHGVT